MNILAHNFVSLILKKYFRKYKDLGISIYQGEIALADAELETNSLSALIASVFQNLICRTAQIAELKACIPWSNDNTREASIFARGLYVKLEFSEEDSMKEENETHTASPLIDLGTKEEEEADQLFANLRKSVVIVLREICIEIAVTDKIVARLDIDYIKMMPFLSKKCKVTLPSIAIGFIL